MLETAPCMKRGWEGARGVPFPCARTLQERSRDGLRYDAGGDGMLDDAGGDGIAYVIAARVTWKPAGRPGSARCEEQEVGVGLRPWVLPGVGLACHTTLAVILGLGLGVGLGVGSG